MKHGKHYVDAAKLVDSTKLYEVNEALELPARPLPPSSTRLSSCTSVWALMAVTLTSRSAALSFCPTAPARPSASALLLRAPQLLLPRLLALISLAMTS